MPRLVAPSRKVTVPVGVPVPGATTATVAVKVTGLAEGRRVGAAGEGGGGGGALDHLATAAAAEVAG